MWGAVMDPLRSLLALGTFGLAVGPGFPGLGLPIAGGASTPIRVITFTRYPPLEIGQELGFYAAEGIDVSVEVTPSSLAQMQGLTSGRWDVAVTAFDTE